jgi:hypothetical protein
MLAMIKVALERRAERHDEELKRQADRPKPRTRSRTRRTAKT